MNQKFWGTSTLTRQEKHMSQHQRFKKSSKIDEIQGKKDDIEAKRMF